MGVGRGHSPRFPPLLLAAWAVPLSLPPCSFAFPISGHGVLRLFSAGWAWGCPHVLQLIPPLLLPWLNWHHGVMAEGPNPFTGLIFLLAAFARADPSTQEHWFQHRRGGECREHWRTLSENISDGLSGQLLLNCILWFSPTLLTSLPSCSGSLSSRWGYPGHGCVSRECQPSFPFSHCRTSPAQEQEWSSN